MGSYVYIGTESLFTRVLSRVQGFTLGLIRLESPIKSGELFVVLPTSYLIFNVSFITNLDFEGH